MLGDDFLDLPSNDGPGLLGSTWDENTYSTDDYAPVHLNREVSPEMFQQALHAPGSVSWVKHSEDYGRDRTEVHNYEMVDERTDETHRIQHYRCGLERSGNYVAFDPDVPERIRWHVLKDMCWQVIAKQLTRIEDKDDSPYYDAIEMMLYELMDDLRKLDRFDWDAFELIIETAFEKREVAVVEHL